MGSVFRATLKRTNPNVCALQKNHGFLPRFFCTGAEQPPQPQDSTATPPSRPFLHTPNSSLTYGRLIGIYRHVMKTDIINFLEGCNLTLEDVKLEYNRSYSPVAAMCQFPSYSAYDNAVRVLMRKGRLYRLERIDRGHWDIVTPYDGRTILIQGLPRNLYFEDLERFLTGCEYDQSSINMFPRTVDGPEPTRMATVRFNSRTQAMNAFIAKNGTYCMNNRISFQVLQ